MKINKFLTKLTSWLVLFALLFNSIQLSSFATGDGSGPDGANGKVTQCGDYECDEKSTAIQCDDCHCDESDNETDEAIQSFNDCDCEEYGIITAFTPLDDEVVFQIVPYASEIEDIWLPEELEGIIDDEPVKVPVMWVSEDFDGYVPGIYTFMVKMSGRPGAVVPTCEPCGCTVDQTTDSCGQTWVLGSTVELPVITVMVEDAMAFGMISAMSAGTGVYDEQLGVIFSPSSSEFKFWARPEAVSNVVLHIYDNHFPGNEPTLAWLNDDSNFNTHQMTRDDMTNVWSATVDGNLDGKFYLYRITSAISNDPRGLATGGRLGNGNRHTGVAGQFFQIDPYATASSANGHLSAIVDFSKTGTVSQLVPRFDVDDEVDHVIYQLHMRDFTIHPSSGISNANKGKYKSLTEKGTTLPSDSDIKTGIDHLIELGVTTVQLMPVFDFAAINELGDLSFDDGPFPSRAYDFGYNPMNYNVPEGSYSSDPRDPATRIKEFKEMVSALHEAGIRVVMDVSYSHNFAGPEWVGNSSSNVLNDSLSLYGGPFDYDMKYFYRWWPDDHADDTSLQNRRADGSGFGNEIADENPMVRKYIIDSLLYWQREFGIDGFRFNNMGLHTRGTMSEASAALKAQAIQIGRSVQDVIIYGEPWSADQTPLDFPPLNGNNDTRRSGKQADSGYANFNDNFRTALIGLLSDHSKGFITEAGNSKETAIFRGVRAWPTTDSGWTDRPGETINYLSAHNELNLWDKIMTAYSVTTFAGITEEEGAVNYAGNPWGSPSVSTGDFDKGRESARLGLGMILTAQGVPYIQAGDEFLRSKGGARNSFHSSDRVNAIDWNVKKQHFCTFEYVQGLIELRREHPAFRMTKHSDIDIALHKLTTPHGTVGYRLQNNANGDDWKNIWVIYNGTNGMADITGLPAGGKHITVNRESAGVENLGTFTTTNYGVPARSMVVFTDSLPWVWDGDGNLLTNLVDGDMIEIRAGASGTLNIPDNSTVTIVGGNTGTPINNGSNTLKIEGNPTTTINWNAFITSTGNPYTIWLTDAAGANTSGGILNINGTIRNTFEREALRVSDGSIVNINSGGLVDNGNGYTAALLCDNTGITTPTTVVNMNGGRIRGSTLFLGTPTVNINEDSTIESIDDSYGIARASINVKADKTLTIEGILTIFNGLGPNNIATVSANNGTIEGGSLGINSSFTNNGTIKVDKFSYTVTFTNNGTIESGEITDYESNSTINCSTGNITVTGTFIGNRVNYIGVGCIRGKEIYVCLAPHGKAACDVHDGCASGNHDAGDCGITGHYNCDGRNHTLTDCPWIWDGNGNLLTSLEDGDVIEIREGANGVLTVPANTTVTIIGGTESEPVVNNDWIDVVIGVNATVIWQAFYSGEIYDELVSVQGTGIFEMPSGRIENNDSDVAIIFNDSVTANIEENAVISGNMALFANGDSKVYINGSTITGINMTIMAQDNSVVEINGGKLSGSGSWESLIRTTDNAKVTITGGTVIMDNIKIGTSDNYGYTTLTINQGATVEISQEERLIINSGSKIINNGTISGGTILNNGIIFNKNGTISSEIADVSTGFITIADHIWDGDAGNFDTPILIVADGDVVEIRADAEGWLGVPANATVTIIGGTESNPVVNNEPLTFFIHADATVIWQAYCSGNVSSLLVSVMGSGTFEMPGGRIENQVATTSAALSINQTVTAVIGNNAVISGSTALSANNDSIVYINGSTIIGLNITIAASNNSIVEINGGNLLGQLTAISNITTRNSAKITITGGTVTMDNIELGNSVRPTTLTINQSATVEIPQGKRLMINSSSKIINNGIITGGTIWNHGIIFNKGTINSVIAIASTGFITIADHIWDGNGNLLTNLKDGDVIEIRAGADGNLNLSPFDGTLTIIGGTESTPIINNNKSIGIELGDDATVIWQVFYSGEIDDALVSVWGTGIFEMPGGRIDNGSDVAIIFYDSVTACIEENTVISGNIALRANGDSTIYINGSIVTGVNITISAQDNSVVEINGGNLSGSESWASFIMTQDNAEITITGGTVIIDNINIGDTGSPTTIIVNHGSIITIDSKMTITPGSTLTVNGDGQLRQDDSNYKGIINNGTIIFDTAGSNNNVNVNIFGTGSITKNGSGELAVTRDFTHAGGTTVNGGKLIIGTDLSGSISGNITLNNNSIVNFARSDDSTFSGDITGGSVEKGGLGTLTLTGAISSDMIVGEGTVQVGDGGTTGNVNGLIKLYDNTNLIFNRDDNITHSGTIGMVTGKTNGSLEKRGTGSLTLTGAVTYNGNTTISEGSLIFNTNFTNAESRTISITDEAALTVASGRTLTNNGTISGLGTIINNGTINCDTGNIKSEIVSGNKANYTATGCITDNSNYICVSPHDNAACYADQGHTVCDPGDHSRCPDPDCGEWLCDISIDHDGCCDHITPLDWNAGDAATCTSISTRQKICTRDSCGYVIESEQQGIVDCIFTKYGGNTATCTEEGIETALCDFGCGEVATRDTNPKGHSRRVSNCTLCSLCDAVLTRNCSTSNPCAAHKPSGNNQGGGTASPSPTPTVSPSPITSPESEATASPTGSPAATPAVQPSPGNDDETEVSSASPSPVPTADPPADTTSGTPIPDGPVVISAVDSEGNVNWLAVEALLEFIQPGATIIIEASGNTIPPAIMDLIHKSEATVIIEVNPNVAWIFEGGNLHSTVELIGTSTLPAMVFDTIRGTDLVVEVVLPNGLVITIDGSTVTGEIGDIDLNIDIFITKQATTVNGTNVPANSIVINPAAHGTFGFELSFELTAGQLSEAGLNGDNVRLYYVDADGNITERGRVKRNADGSVTITIDGASFYFLAEATVVVDKNRRNFIPFFIIGGLGVVVMLAGGVIYARRRRV